MLSQREVNGRGLRLDFVTAVRGFPLGTRQAALRRRDAFRGNGRPPHPAWVYKKPSYESEAFISLTRPPHRIRAQ